MATYTKAGVGIAGFRGIYWKEGVGIAGLPWLSGTNIKKGYGVAGTVGSGRKVPHIKKGSGVARLVGGGGRGGGRILTKTGGAANPWVEPPFMEDYYGIHPKGSGGKVVTVSIGKIKAGGASAGLTGSGAEASTFVERAAGVTGLVGSGRRTQVGAYQKRGAGVAHPIGSGWRAVSGRAKRGGASAGLVGSGYDNWRVVQGRILVRVGAYDETSIAGIVVTLDGVAVGAEVTANLDQKGVNGRFETDMAWWYQTGGATVARSTGEHKYGVASLSVTTAANDQGVFNQMAKPLLAGRYYRVGAWVKGTAGEWVEFDVITYQSPWVRVGDPMGVLTNGAWQFVSFDVKSLTTETHVLRVLSKTGAQTFYLDAVSIVQHAEMIVDTATLSNGHHTLGALIRDAAGHLVLGSTIDVSVANAAVPEPMLKVEIAMDSDPRDDVQVWSDVTADFDEGSWGHGRSEVLSRMEAGQLSLRLRNHSRRYDAVNPASPYFGKFVVGKRIRTTAIYNDQEFRRFTGSISQIRPEWTPGGKGAYVSVSATDDFTPMSRAPISTFMASLTTSMAGADNDFTVTALAGGGDNVTLEIQSPGIDLAPPPIVGLTTVTQEIRAEKWVGSSPDTGAVGEAALEVVSRDIIVIPSYAGGVITSTAQEIVDAINASTRTNGIVFASVAVGSTGTGVVTEYAKTSLVGGAISQQLSGDRVRWVLDKIKLPESRREVDAGTVTVQAVELDRQAALDHAQLVEASELGQFFFDGDGNAVFHDQNRRTNTTIKQTYADVPSTAVGEHLYIDATPEQGTDIVYNDIEVTAPNLAPARAADATSANRFWPSALDHATLLTSADELEDRALLLLGRFKAPIDDLKSMVLEPMREAVAYGKASAWPAALGLEVSDKLHVRRSPPGGGTLLYETFVESVGDYVTAGDRRSWKVVVGMTVAFLSGSSASGGGGGVSSGTPWVLDDPALSLLDTTTRVA